MYIVHCIQCRIVQTPSTSVQCTEYSAHFNGVYNANNVCTSLEDSLSIGSTTATTKNRFLSAFIGRLDFAHIYKHFFLLLKRSKLSFVYKL